ncbi:MAG TPA: hypothetical protein VGF95_08385 [Solirubrobacteraceae bacterium]
MLAAGLIAVSAGPSSAYEYKRVYCSRELPVDGTCPPYGSPVSLHIELNLANAGGEEHAVCADIYYEAAKEYTAAHCFYHTYEEAAIVPGNGSFGYPRAWNAGTIEHFVYAEEYGYGAVI